jgi:hypothetical protein
MVLFDVPAFLAMEHAALERPYRDQRHEHEHRGEDANPKATESDDHPDCCDHPDGSRGGQASDVCALPEDGARAEKADTGDNLRGDAGGIGAAAEKRLKADCGEQARADADQRHRANARRVAMKLTLGPDGDRQDEGDDDAKGEIQIAAKRQRR